MSKIPTLRGVMIFECFQRIWTRILKTVTRDVSHGIQPKNCSKISIIYIFNLTCSRSCMIAGSYVDFPKENRWNKRHQWKGLLDIAAAQVHLYPRNRVKSRLFDNFKTSLKPTKTNEI